MAFAPGALPKSEQPVVEGLRLRVLLLAETRVAQSSTVGIRSGLSAPSPVHRRAPAQPARLPAARRRYNNRKLTSTCALTITGLPFLSPGLKRHCLTASIAFSSRPSPTPFATRKLRVRPL